MAVASAGIANLKYSREAEAQADAFGIEMLRSNGISTRPAAALFRTLQTRATDKSGDAGVRKTPVRHSDYLDSHPATEDRIKALEAATPQDAPQ